jgi:excisionase family DNA binding protein
MRNEGKLVDSFDEACENVGISRAQGYREVAAGNLKTFMVGRRRKVTKEAQRKFVELKQRESAKAAA